MSPPRRRGAVDVMWPGTALPPGDVAPRRLPVVDDDPRVRTVVAVSSRRRWLTVDSASGAGKELFLVELPLRTRWASCDASAPCGDQPGTANVARRGADTVVRGHARRRHDAPFLLFDGVREGSRHLLRCCAAPSGPPAPWPASAPATASAHFLTTAPSSATSGAPRGYSAPCSSRSTPCRPRRARLPTRSRRLPVAVTRPTYGPASIRLGGRRARCPCDVVQRGRSGPLRPCPGRKSLHPAPSRSYARTARQPRARCARRTAHRGRGAETR